MATVGERYQKVWQAAWDRQVPDAKGISFTDEAHRCMDAAVPGLWGAAIEEWTVCSDFPVCGHPFKGGQQTVRIIVLPKEEK